VSPLLGTHLDPKLIVARVEYTGAPILDRLLHESVEAGSNAVLDLIRYLDDRDARLYEPPAETTQSFRAIEAPVKVSTPEVVSIVAVRTVDQSVITRRHLRRKTTTPWYKRIWKGLHNG